MLSCTQYCAEGAASRRKMLSAKLVRKASSVVDTDLDNISGRGNDAKRVLIHHGHSRSFNSPKLTAQYAVHARVNVSLRTCM